MSWTAADGHAEAAEKDHQRALVNARLRRIAKSIRTQRIIAEGHLRALEQLRTDLVEAEADAEALGIGRVVIDAIEQDAIAGI